MKKIVYSASLCLMLSGCATMGADGTAALLGALASNQNSAQMAGAAASSTANAVGSMISTATSGNNLSNLLSSIIGLDKMTQQDIVGTWKYSRPGCAFMTEQTLAKAGGEMVAANVKEKLASTYKTVGIKSTNTNFTFNTDGTFTGKMMGQSIAGNYKFNEKNQELTLSTLLFSLSGYAKKNSDGIAILFESKKILQLVQMAGAVSGNSTLTTVSDLAKNYDGVRMGFDLVK